MYRMPCPLCFFLSGFILLINELPIQHRILIIGDFNLGQMLPEYIVKVDPVNMSHNIQLIFMGEYWVWCLILQISNFKLQTSDCCRPKVVILNFFFQNLRHYIYTEFRCKQFSFQSS